MRTRPASARPGVATLGDAPEFAHGTPAFCGVANADIGPAPGHPALFRFLVQAVYSSQRLGRYSLSVGRMHNHIPFAVKNDRRNKLRRRLLDLGAQPHGVER